jgi:anti-anti-sigma factor
MQAQVAQDGDILVIRLSGRVDVETAEPFQTACVSHLKGKKAVFDFTGLSFVGSSGILPFLQTLQDFASAHPNGMKFSGVGGEFRKIFAATPLRVIEICDTIPQAVAAFSRPFFVPSIQENAFAGASVPTTSMAPMVSAEKSLNGVIDVNVSNSPELLALKYEVEPD